MAAIALVDTDAHITESPDLWTSRVSSKWGDLVPHLELVDPPKTFAESRNLVFGEHLPKMQAWYSGDVRLAMAGASAYAGWHEPFPLHPPTIEEAHPASNDLASRLAVMDEQGIYAQALYPNVGGFGSARFRQMKEQELALECVRAYNDFLVDWTEPAAGRFIRTAAIPYWDIEATVSEAERVAGLGFKALIFSGAPQEHGLPFLAEPHWVPLWEVAERHGLAISFHLGSGNFHGRHFNYERVRNETPEDSFARLTTMGFLEGALHVTDLLHSGVLSRHPGLKFIAAESGIGWVPFVLEAADYHFLEGTGGRRTDDLLPSERFRRQVYVSFWFEQIAPARLIDCIGRANVIFETDFPHPSCLWPSEAVGAARENLSQLPDELQRRVLQTNAAELFGIDPTEVHAWESAAGLRA